MAEDEQEDTESLTSTDGLGQPLRPLALPLQQKESITTIPTAFRQNSARVNVEEGGDNSFRHQTVRNVIKNKNDSELKHMSSNLSLQEETAKTSGGGVWCSLCKGTGAIMSSHLQPLDGGREPHTADKSVEFLSVDYFLMRKNSNEMIAFIITYFSSAFLKCVI